MSKTVVILSPDDGGKEDVEGGNPVAPFYLEALLEPFAVLTKRISAKIRKHIQRGGGAKLYTWLTMESITWMNGS